MRPVFVLAHSLYVGPLTCGPVADALAAWQDDSVILSLGWLTRIHRFCPRVVDVVNAAMSPLDQGQCVLLVAHSKAPLRAVARQAQSGACAVARQAHRPARPVLLVRRCRASRSSRADAGCGTDRAAGLPTR